MKLCKLVLSLLVICLWWGSAARADEAPSPLGDWVQIASNAGQCPTCRLSISTAGSSFKVQANNRWSAVVEATDIPTLVSGAGRWDANTRMTYSGKGFKAHFFLYRDVLRMHMSVDLGNGKLRVIRGEYKRGLLSS